MINRINLIRNIGCFDSFAGSSLADFKELVLIYAENGRGKTTISSILSSLASNNGAIITSRKRIGATHEPNVILSINGSDGSTIFEAGAWNNPYDNIYVFDDDFVNQNVYSGLEVTASHRQGLHEIVLGRTGVALVREVQTLTEHISEFTSTMRQLTNQIPSDDRHGLDIDTFCNLDEVDDIDHKIESKQNEYDAVREADAISRQSIFSQLSFPEIDVEALESVLVSELADLDQSAVEHISQHCLSIGDNGESWISSGVERIMIDDTGQHLCPFCKQVVDGLDLIGEYRAYFGVAYRSQIQQISSLISQYSGVLSGDNLSSKQTEVTTFVNLHEFWKKFVTLPEFTIDWNSLSDAWQAARNRILQLLRSKQGSPLSLIVIDEEVRGIIEEYVTQSNTIQEEIAKLIRYNNDINDLKARVSTGDVQTVNNELISLKANKARYSEELKNTCEQYLSAKRQKESLEERKRTARAALDSHRQSVFVQYHESINAQLSTFGTNFRIGGLVSSNAAGRPSTEYHIIINQQQVPLTGQGRPSFKNTLSAGDRNALGLAFFFASVNAEQDLNDSIIVLDDPFSSLDDGRTATTIQKIRTLLAVAKQVIILCHSRSFLCDVWEGSDQDNITTLKLSRGANNTTVINYWDVSRDTYTEYDKRHKVLRDYVNAETDDPRHVAECLRPVMEKYCRIAFTAHCPPGTLLGTFRNHVENLLRNGQSIMSQPAITELKEITDYANKFHHDTNPAWASEQIRDTELLTFVRRVLAFTQHN